MQGGQVSPHATPVTTGLSQQHSSIPAGVGTHHSMLLSGLSAGGSFRQSLVSGGVGDRIRAAPSPSPMEPLCIAGDREVQFGLRWDFVGDEPIDLDASCVSFDTAGNPGEVVFFNNLSTKGEWMIHTGDNTTGEGDDDDEAIQICLGKVPQDVFCLMLTITCHNKGYDFSHVEQIGCSVTDLETGQEVYEGGIPVHLSRVHTAAIVCSIRRVNDTPGCPWELRVHNTPAHGHHVGDTRLLHTMQGLLDFPEAKRRKMRAPELQIQYETEKREVAQLPLDLNHLIFGVGWTREDSDLDSTVLMLDDKGRYVDHVSSKSKHETADKSTAHHGDNAFDPTLTQQQRDAKSRGDKEQIDIYLEQVSPLVHYVFFVVTVITREHVWNIGRLPNTPGGYCRLTHLTKKKNFKGGTTNVHDRLEVCRTQLGSIPQRDATCLVFASVYREAATGRWAIEKVDEAMSGTGTSTPDDFIPFVRCLSYFMGAGRLREQQTWLTFRDRAKREKIALQLTVVEAKDLGPEDRNFHCHCQVWVMDKPRDRSQRQHTRPLQDRVELSWNESFNFRVSLFDSLRVLCYDWGFVGTVDLPLAKIICLAGEGTGGAKSADSQFVYDPEFEVDDWFQLQGPEVEGSLRLQLRRSRSMGVSAEDEAESCCCIM
eukprot:TRINITY_DN10675_c0_g1_i1.p1 TRINITY_DN10675_c0_g1~~TRINITY_DN10675_c0_g1_i1.p1  ORF type:complete len:685 (+),score=246.32 TRINITY_DN10675_c0_g1_i1:97-2055(+)